MVKISNKQILHLAPNAQTVYQQGLEEADNILAGFDINATKLRVCHFMAQVLHETGGLTILRENMNYSAKRMTQVWPSRFPTLKSAEPFAHKPRELADKVYNGRMGNQNGTDDGWNFIGRGLLQVTGRSDYKKYGDMLGVDMQKNPELSVDPRYTLKIAAEEWTAKDCNPDADADSIRTITKKINGGLAGIAEREEWLKKTKSVWL